MKANKTESKVKWIFLNQPSQKAIEDYNKVIAKSIKRALLQSQGN